MESLATTAAATTATSITIDTDHPDAEGDDERLPASRDAEARALEPERRTQEAQQALFKKLKLDAQAINGLSRGVPGVRTPAQLAALLEKAGDEIGNGKFIV